MGRFLACSYLSNHLNILCALQFSISCIHNNKKYYKAFHVTNDIRNKGDLTVFIINFLEIYLSGLVELKENIESTIGTYNYALQKITNHILAKHQSLVEILLQATLFDIEGLSMSQLVETTQYTQQTIRTLIKSINKDYDIIEINKEHKPYRYKINLDVVSTME